MGFGIKENKALKGKFFVPKLLRFHHHSSNQQVRPLGSELASDHRQYPEESKSAGVPKKAVSFQDNPISDVTAQEHSTIFEAQAKGVQTQRSE